jgi:hypothetical protein
MKGIIRIIRYLIFFSPFFVRGSGKNYKDYILKSKQKKWGEGCFLVEKKQYSQPRSEPLKADGNGRHTERWPSVWCQARGQGPSGQKP